MNEKIVIVGQPNSGKSSLFNALTGLDQTVGNWPGVTVEKKEGFLFIDGERYEVVDLPGLYGLTPTSLDEKISLDFLLESSPSLIVNILDGSNLERSLFLSLQLFFLDIPIIFFVNKMDVAKSKGIKIDEKKLKEIFSCDIVFGSVKNGEGLDELKESIKNNIHKKICETKYFKVSDKIYSYIEKISEILIKYKEFEHHPKFFALKIIEDDGNFSPYIFKILDSVDLSKIKKNVEELYKDFKKRDFLTLDWFYSLSRGITGEVTKREIYDKKSLTEEIDNTLLNRFFSIPIFLITFLFIFFLTFFFGDIFSKIFSIFFETVSTYLSKIFEKGFLLSFFTEGLIGGLGSVITLIPYIFFMYFFLGFLEDTGYLARVVFIMDRFMHKIGLHGKSFISLILGFGCSVPAVLSTRVLDTPKDRIKTILIIPFIPCSSRLTVLIFLGAIIFGKFDFLIIFVLFVLSLIFAIFSGFVFDKFILKEKSEGLIMELPDYHLPTLKNLLLNSYFKVKDFIKRAGTLIFLITVIVFLLSYFPQNVDGGFIRIGGEKITFLFRPLGFDVERTVSLITGFFAKESVVSTLGVLYKGEQLEKVIKTEWGRIDGFVFLLFLMIYLPCIATAIVIRQETGSYFYLSGIIVYSVFFAYIISFIVRHFLMLIF
ncbi:MAG: ferrous iron transport protein B [candidate division WOR-3 bacterium]